LHHAGEQALNVVARVRGTGPGRRVVLNGHLDTYPLGDPSHWTRNPAGEIDGGRLYGRGAADMKGGIAASIAALAALAEHRGAWSGEAVLTLAGDEESMGPARHPLAARPRTARQGRRCDPGILDDAGSPRILRVGGSDARWFRMEGVPTVVYGPTPHNMGGPDEWVDIAELDQVARVHALTVFDLLTANP